MSHLTPEQLIDAAERAETPHAGMDDRAAAHVRACAQCRARLDDLRAAMMMAAEGRAVPEPSPLFWDHLSARVHHAVASAPDEPRPWRVRARFGWTLGAAAAAVAILVAVSLGSRIERATPGGERLATSIARDSRDDSTAPLNDLPADDSWELIADLTPPMDWDAAGEAGIVRPGTSDHALSHLSDAERDELKRLLTLELEAAEPSS